MTTSAHPDSPPPTGPDLCRMTAVDALAGMRTGAWSAEALGNACLSRAAAREPEVHAWAWLEPAQVVARARELDGEVAALGALHGLPIGIKDVILTRDMPTQYNSDAYRGFAPQVDAACVALLRQAGANIFGKTETVEFGATGRVAPTCNPHRPTHTPGGSSSGSAAAVADGHVPLALGTQTGGSIIRPASYCGVFGLKPTWNIVSREGAKMFSASLDTIGWFARSAEDLGLLLEVLAPEPDDALPTADSARPFDWAGARIALYPSPSWPLAEEATRQAFAQASALIRSTGAEVVELTLPPVFDTLVELQNLIMRAEGRSAFLAEYRLQGPALHDSFRRQVENADGFSRAALRTAYDVAAQCRAVFDAAAAEYDAVLTPSTLGEAPEGLAATGSLAFNAVWSLLHVPCVNVPGLTGPSGLPVGLTLTGPRFGDRQVLRVAAALGALLRPSAVDEAPIFAC